MTRSRYVTATIVMLFIAAVAHGKPGGHRSVEGHCAAKFQFLGPYAELAGPEPVDLYLGQTGFASFNGVPVYGDFDAREALASRAVAMQWEVNNCFAGNRPEWGIISSIGKTSSDSDARSTITFVADTDKELFPATTVAQLYFDINIPKFGLTIFNKEPVVLQGKSRNIDFAKDVDGDYRVQTRGRSGIPALLRKAMQNREQDRLFEPLGQYSLVKPVAFYRRDRPDEVVAMLIASDVNFQIHYGIDIECLSTRVDGVFMTGEVEIRNLTDRVEDVVWYVADSHELTIVAVSYVNEEGTWIVSKETVGRTRLGTKPLRLTVQAYNNNPAHTIGTHACVFVSAQNTPRDINAFKTEAVSGFLVIQGDDFVRLQRPARAK